MLLLEEAHNAAFPYDRSALKHLTSKTGQKVYGKGLHDKPEGICLYFGGSEHEGLPDGTYRFDRDARRLFDNDGDEINVRDFSFDDCE